MAQFDALDVEWNATAFTRHVDHLVRIDEKDARLRIEEAADQPGAGDAVDFRPPARHPTLGRRGANRSSSPFATKSRPAAQLLITAPFHHARVDSVRAQLRDRALAHFVTGFAGDCNRTRRIEIVHPLVGFAASRQMAPGNSCGDAS